MPIKIFISDIHLSDATTGDHNITLNTLDSFWNDIQKDITNAGGEKELIILGDFIDVIRSTKWSGNNQPWMDVNTIKGTVDVLVDDVIAKNNQIFAELRKYVGTGLKITYIMGNHDRLINSDGYDNIRIKIQNALGITPTGDKFPWEYQPSGLPIYAVHGNNFDPYNRTENNALPIGDAVATLLLNQYPEEVNNSLNNPQVYKDLQEIDNLRPYTITPYWIDYIKSNLPLKEQNKLKEIWNRLVDEFRKNDFVKDWFHVHDHWYSLFDDADKLEIALNHFTDSTAEKLYEKFLEIKKDFIKETDHYAKEAVKFADKYDYVLFGHSHESCIHLLDVAVGKEKYYINTGTWRKRIIPGGYKRKGIVFGRQESIDYAIFTIDNSNKITSFQLWNGSVGAS